MTVQWLTPPPDEWIANSSMMLRAIDQTTWKLWDTAGAVVCTTATDVRDRGAERERVGGGGRIADGFMDGETCIERRRRRQKSAEPRWMDRV